MPIRSSLLGNAATAFLGRAYVAEHPFAAQLEEVFVTARRREPRLADVGIFVTALSGQHVCQRHRRN